MYTFSKISAVLLTCLLAGCAGTAKLKNAPPVPPEAMSKVFEYPIPADAPNTSQEIVKATFQKTSANTQAPDWLVARFRPNINMPEILLSELHEANFNEKKMQKLNDEIEKGKRLNAVVPRLQLIPCDEGCVGNKNYEKLAKVFIDSYNEIVLESGGAATFRGEMRVKVRWFREKTFIERINPLTLAQEVFAIQFPIEGNMLTISKSGWGKDTNLKSMVERLAMQFKTGVILPLQLGQRNVWSVKFDPAYDPSVLEQFSQFSLPVTDTISKILGHDDYSPRVDPITEEHKALLPAIDGIFQGEGMTLDKGGRRFVDG